MNLVALKLAIVATAMIGVFVLAGMGKIDATVALGSIVALVTGLTVALGISGAGSSIAQSMGSSPPPAATTNVVVTAPPKSGQAGFIRMRELVVILALSILVFLGARAVAGCAGAEQQVQNQAYVVAYADEEQECVTEADTLVGARQCIARVKERWCLPGGRLYEAGACVYDGGALEGGGQ